MGLMDLFKRKSNVDPLDSFGEEVSDDADSSLPAVGASEEKHRFAEYLLKKGLVSQTAVHAALMEQKITGDQIGTILVRNGSLRQDVLIPTVLEFNTAKIATEHVEESFIPVEVLEKFSIIISAVTSDKIYIGTLSDENDVREIVEEAYPDKEVVFVAFMPERLGEFLDRIRRSNSFIDEGDDVREDEMLDSLLSRGFHLNATDMHIEPRHSTFSVFFRILGERQLVHEGNLEQFHIIMAQLKDRSRMDLAERRLPQDGGFQIERNGRFIDLRVATVPLGGDLEKAIIRILDPERVNPDLDVLGITGLIHWRRGTSRKDGICLICGATGSGKTTTLNATIRGFDRFGQAIYTIEDPVEYNIPFVSQVSANPQVGLDYSRAVKNFMRADPDIIIVGEIRDEETARNAVKASDTGHLVIGTLHTNSIIGTLSRLRDLGVDPNELSYNLRAILVQTLVKTKCIKCSGHGFIDSVPCPVCNGFRYSSRTVVSECMSFSNVEEVDNVIKLISDPEVGRNKPLPWRDIIDDAILKMTSGLTDSEEIVKIFGSAAVDRAKKIDLDLMEYSTLKDPSFLQGIVL